MSSLWTPGGEHRVPPTPGEPPAGQSTGGGGAAPATESGRTPGGGEGGPAPTRPRRASEPEDRELDEEMRQLADQLLATPAADVVANHCYGMFELAALHLGARPPQLAEARVAIDALAAVVEALGDRLGEAAPTLRDALAQIRLAYVQIATASGGSDAAPS